MSYKVISVDPGETSGYCYAVLKDQQLTYFPFEMVDDVHELYARLGKFQPDFIVIEKFLPRRGRGAVNLFPVQLIGVARLYGYLSDTRVFQQSPNIMGEYFSLTMMRRVGLYKRGLVHGMSASQHLLHWTMFGFGNQFIGKQQTEEFAILADELEFWND